MFKFWYLFVRKNSEVLFLSIVQKMITRNSEFSLPSMIPRVTEKLRVIVSCIGPKPITRSPDSPYREFRNFQVFREFGVITICAMVDSLTSETGILMSNDFLKIPRESDHRFKDPREVSYLFLTPEIFRLKIIFHTNMQGCIAKAELPFPSLLKSTRAYASLFLKSIISFYKRGSAKEVSPFLVKDNLVQIRYGG